MCCVRLLIAAVSVRMVSSLVKSLQVRDAQIDNGIPVGGATGNRQEMWNYEDMQYFTSISVGGQAITGIIDTGSFELVVFEKHCNGCGLAGRYDKAASTTHTTGPLEQRLYYGSGDIYVRQVFDLVSVGTFDVINLTFWEGDDAHMPVLESAKFQSIVGVGPPETPANDFWQKTAESLAKVTSSLQDGVFPPATATNRVMEHLQESIEMSRHKTLLDQYKVSIFSLCLGKRPGSSGFFIWNDTSAYDYPALFSRVAVIGRHTWTVNMTDVHLANYGDNEVRHLGCERGCGAVIDSGTSLLMMPRNIVDLLEDTIRRLGPDCTEMRTLPEFVFTLDGHRFSLPPDAYLAEMDEAESFDQGEFSGRIRNLKFGARCQLTVMESYSDTHWGPLWIIGMPFFRKYYTSFNVGRDHSERSLYVAPASPGCTPTSTNMVLAADRSPEFMHRRFNLSHMYHSPLVRQAATSKFVHL